MLNWATPLVQLQAMQIRTRHNLPLREDPKTHFNQPITFNTRELSDKYKIATALCQQFSNTILQTETAAHTFKLEARRENRLYHYILCFLHQCGCAGYRSLKNLSSFQSQWPHMKHRELSPSNTSPTIQHISTVRRHPATWKYFKLFRQE